MNITCSELWPQISFDLHGNSRITQEGSFLAVTLSRVEAIVGTDSLVLMGVIACTCNLAILWRQNIGTVWVWYQWGVTVFH